MARRGRKRRDDAPRGATGRIKSQHYRSPADREALRAQIKDDARAVRGWIVQREAARRMALDPMMGSRVGKMFVWGDPLWIDECQMEAAKRIAQIVFDYERKWLGAVSTPQAMDMAQVRGLRLSVDNEAAALRSRQLFDQLCEWLGAYRRSTFQGKVLDKVDHANGRLRNSAMFNAVRTLCYENEIPADIALAVTGLEIVADALGLRENSSGRLRRWRDDETKAARAAGIMTPQGEEEVDSSA